MVTPDQFASTQQTITQTLTDAGVVVNKRQQLALLGETTEVAEGRQYAASTASINDAADPNDWALRNRMVAWAEGFGSYQERGQTSDSSESTARSGGMMAGVDLPQSSSGYRGGLYVGGFAGSVDIGTTTFRTIDSAGGLGGGYIGHSYGDVYVSMGLGLGFSNNDSTRLTGVDKASADYTSYFISPSVTVMRPFKGDVVTWVPSLTLRYAAQYDDGYTETGSTSGNQKVDSRVTHTWNGRAMVEARMASYNVLGNAFTPALRGGIQGQALLGDNNVDVTVLGSKLTFDPQGGYGTVDAVIGTTLNYEITQRLNVYFDGEANLGLNHGGVSDNKGAVGRLGARWAF
ncbi:MAG: autotransporter outer membrane beta-barrel domain-containing protein [Alphaproteobacteria bacterium]|nr:autotransporter outer membrane beta-barrel domain-containing protein [Alphaproteobacteria bacterium]